MVKPLSRIVGFGPLILGIPILVGEIKPHLHYCGSKQNTFVWLQSSSIPSFWPKKKNILLWFLVNEVKSTCFQTWVKIFSVAETKMDQKKSAGEYCHPAAPNIASHASPRRRFRDQLCHPCHLLFRARNLIGHLFGATNVVLPRREFRLQTIFSVHQESGVHWVHLFIAILSSKDTWLLRKIENLSNTNGQNGRSKRRE